ncbi:multicomponent Na+:H+ antiporter subunit D [Caldalkalibacillus uzonensis]|uniref:Multicomponent Na+:H+ antiporter subunit D n=1 Tax=Caldalkalibacillus uzonensis TaxID=353224 RepID=A0ABU0CT26_9BACI|nr:Na+/H+ antiporter subunit D [Caldalkalibacillus uzonensis]MDQ0339581.1 multicomponent Na+:H+ antiporter subunit D [Caldalkalibacillus uzonensis]
MNNVVILPVVIPLITGIVLILAKKNLNLQRSLSVLSFAALIVAAGRLVHLAATEGIQTLYLGSWVPPFGIVLVADMFASLLVLTAGIVSLACLLYSFSAIDKDRESYFYYPLVQFIVAGVCGSFLTGDIFNLFVFFEVMLIASYALISLGGEKRQLRESLKYVLVNIISSVMFVMAVAYLYATLGTLNMADLSLRVAAVGQEGIVTVIAILFMIVFSLKSALFLYYWLPGSYSAPPAPIAALFGGLLTKVGIYALFRSFTLIFYHQPEVTHQLLAWLAGLTMVLGVLGAVAHWDVRKILAYNIVVAVGFIVFGLAVSSSTALSGAIYYLLHDMIIKALLFLLGGSMIAVAGTGQLRKMGGLIKRYPVLGWMFFIGALALAGIPPLSGFIGKLLLIQGGLEQGLYWLVAVSLGTSLLVLYSMLKIFMNGFWGEEKNHQAQGNGSITRHLVPCGFLVALAVGLGLGAEWVIPYIQIATETLLNPELYIQAVLKE